MRTAMILVGAWLIAQFHWILYLFGAFLLATGVKMLVVEFIKIPVAWSLGMVATILAVSVVASLLRKPADG